MKETKMVFDDVNNQQIASKIDTDIVSIDREDKPLIYISEEAIYLKIDNDNLRKENNQYKIVLDKIKEILGKYKHYSTPNEKQNAENEEIVDKAYELLEENNENNNV